MGMPGPLPLARPPAPPGIRPQQPPQSIDGGPSGEGSRGRGGGASGRGAAIGRGRWQGRGRGDCRQTFHLASMSHSRLDGYAVDVLIIAHCGVDGSRDLKYEGPEIHSASAVINCM